MVCAQLRRDDNLNLRRRNCRESSRLRPENA
jgi:hypothetical protein